MILNKYKSTSLRSQYYIATLKTSEIIKIMDNKTKKIITWLLVVIVVFAAGFGSGYLFGKSSGPGRFSEIPDGFGGVRNSGNNVNSGSNSETENDVNSGSDSLNRNIRQQPGTQAPEGQTPEGQMPQDIQAE